MYFNSEMRKLIKSILPEVGVGDLKIRSRGDNRCGSAKRHPSILAARWDASTFGITGK